MPLSCFRKYFSGCVFILIFLRTDVYVWNYPATKSSESQIGSFDISGVWETVDPTGDSCFFWPDVFEVVPTGEAHGDVFYEKLTGTYTIDNDIMTLKLFSIRKWENVLIRITVKKINDNCISIRDEDNEDIIYRRGGRKNLPARSAMETPQPTATIRPAR